MVNESGTVQARLRALTCGRRLWWVAFLAFFLMGSAWATAAPYNGTADEINHILHAAGVGRGEFFPHKATRAEGAGAFHHVKAGLIKTNLCWQGNREKSAACGAEPDGNQTLVWTPSYAGRYPPLYYATIGWPLALWPNWFGVLLARILSAAIVAALLASGAYALIRWTRHTLMPAAVIVAVTPLTLHFSGSINPAATEIAAGFALFAALTALTSTEKSTERSLARGAAITLAGVSALTLILVRPLGPLLMLIVLGTMFVPGNRQVLGRLAAGRAVRVWLGAMAVACALAVAWTELMHTGEPGWVSPVNITFKQALKFELTDRTAGYATEIVGIMSWLDAPMPGLSYTIWFMAFGLLLLTALALGSWTYRWRIALISVTTFAMLVIGDAMSAKTLGFVSQGRYALPIAIGLPILAASALSERGNLPEGYARAITRTFALILVPIHVFALLNTMLRWQYGIPKLPKVESFNPLAGAWLPPLGPELPIVLALASAVLLLGFAWATTTAATTAPALAAESHGGDLSTVAQPQP